MKTRSVNKKAIDMSLKLTNSGSKFKKSQAITYLNKIKPVKITNEKKKFESVKKKTGKIYEKQDQPKLITLSKLKATRRETRAALSNNQEPISRTRLSTSNRIPIQTFENGSEDAVRSNKKQDKNHADFVTAKKSTHLAIRISTRSKEVPQPKSPITRKSQAETLLEQILSTPRRNSIQRAEKTTDASLSYMISEKIERSKANKTSSTIEHTVKDPTHEKIAKLKSNQNKSKVIEEDPYKLSDEDEENKAPALTTAFKRKFFFKTGESRAKRNALSVFELLKGKMCGHNAKRRPFSQMNVKQSQSRSQPFSDADRMRMAATTIWLPMPPIAASKPFVDTMFSTPSNTISLTSKPVMRPSVFLSQANVSPINHAEESKGIVDANNTTVLTSLPHRDVVDHMDGPSDTSTSKTSVQVEDNNVREDAYLVSSHPLRTSFAQIGQPGPILSSPLHNEKSSIESSTRSHSGHKSRQRSTSHEEDASNYEDWLEVFGAQLKQFEDFNLSIE